MGLRGDVPLRLASLALAGGLWFVIAGRQTAERGDVLTRHKSLEDAFVAMTGEEAPA